MTTNRAIEIIETEKECVERAGMSVPNKSCERDCWHCDLLMADAEIIQAYDFVLEHLRTRQKLIQSLKEIIEKENIKNDLSSEKTYRGRFK